MSVSINENLRKIEATSIQKGIFASEQSVRGFSFLIDEPEKIGGGNQAPTPLEYVLGSFNGCLQVVIEVVAREIDFDYAGLEQSTVGWADRRALNGEDVLPYYHSVENRIVFSSKETPERLSELKTVVLKRCPLYNLLKSAGVTLNLEWKLK